MVKFPNWKTAISINKEAKRMQAVELATFQMVLKLFFAFQNHWLITVLK